MYKFLEDLIFADDPKSRIYFENHLLSSFSSKCIVIVLRNFEDLIFVDLIFVDDKLSVRTAKIMSFKNLLYVYGR